MTKKVISIVSVLKPVDDTRNYEKIATSIGNTNKYDINIIGFTSKNAKPHDSIIFHSLGTFPRLSWSRVYAPFKVYKYYLKVKPDAIFNNGQLRFFQKNKRL